MALLLRESVVSVMWLIVMWVVDDCCNAGRVAIARNQVEIEVGPDWSNPSS